MPKWHHEILTKEQVELLPLVKKFAKDFFMVGGTAIALHLGHRRSIDFDLFSLKGFQNNPLRTKIQRHSPIHHTIVNKKGEFTLVTHRVKITFYYYPFSVPASKKFRDISLPTLLDLAVMKAHALGQRAKWKDYVDLYFILKEQYNIAQIAARADALFGGEFNEKIFRTQLSYFNDINYEEEINYLPGYAVDDETVKMELSKFSLM